MYLLHHTVQHVVALPEVMVEGQRHAVPYAAALQHLAYAGHQLAAVRVTHAMGLGRSLLIAAVIVRIAAREDLLAGGAKNLIRYLASYCISHTSSPP